MAGLPDENKIQPVPNMYSPSRPDNRLPGDPVDMKSATPFQKIGGSIGYPFAKVGQAIGGGAALAVSAAERVPGAVKQFWKWGNTVPGAAKDSARAAVQQVTGGGAGAPPAMGSAMNRPQMTQGDNANVLASPRTPVIAPPPQAGQGGSAASIPELYTNRPEVAWSKGGHYLAREGGNFEEVAPGMGQAAFEARFGKGGYQPDVTRRAEATAAGESAAAMDRANRIAESGWSNVPAGGGQINAGGGRYISPGEGRRESVPSIPGLSDTENALIQAGMAYEKKGGFYARNHYGSQTWVPERIIPTGSASSMVNARANEEQNRITRENALLNAGVQERGDLLRYQSDVGRTEQQREEAALGREVTREGYGYDILGKRMMAQAGIDKTGMQQAGKAASEGINEYEYGRLRSEALANDFGGELRNSDGTINEDALAARIGTRGPSYGGRQSTLPRSGGAGRWEYRTGAGGQQQRRWVAE